MGEKDQVIIKNIQSLLDLKSVNATSIYLKSMKRTFSLKLKRKVFLLIFFILSCLFLLNMAFPHLSAVKVIENISGDINIIILPIFAVIITGYAIFQAMVNSDTVVRLLRVKHEGKESKFEIYNLYFFGLSCSYLILIILNFILLIISKNIDPHWSLSRFSKSVNETISAMLISLYLSLILYFLIELKSFIYNLFQVFLTSASDMTVNHLKRKQESSRDNNSE